MIRRLGFALKGSAPPVIDGRAPAAAALASAARRRNSSGSGHDRCRRPVAVEDLAFDHRLCTSSSGAAFSSLTSDTTIVRWRAPSCTVQRKSLRGYWIETTTAHRRVFQLDRKRQATLGWPRAWFFSRQQITFRAIHESLQLQNDRLHD